MSDMDETECDAIKCTSGVASDSDMLMRAEHYIEKLKMELKEKECAINEHVKRWQFYEQIVRNLTTFK